MEVRVLLVLAALAVLYSCGREESPVGAQKAGVEGSTPASEPQPLPD